MQRRKCRNGKLEVSADPSRRNLLKATVAGLLAGPAVPLLPDLPRARAQEKRPGGTRVLIAYYSLTGITKRIADKIREKTCGDVFEIEAAIPYSTERAVVREVVRSELERGELRALKRNPPDMTAHDLILIGSPVWWYTLSIPAMSYLRLADFAGKNVAAFCTHEGGTGRFFQHFMEQAKNAVVLEGLDLYRPQQAQAGEVDRALDSWLGKLRK